MATLFGDKHPQWLAIYRLFPNHSKMIVVSGIGWIAHNMSTDKSYGIPWNPCMLLCICFTTSYNCWFHNVSYSVIIFFELTLWRSLTHRLANNATLSWIREVLKHICLQAEHRGEGATKAVGKKKTCFLVKCNANIWAQLMTTLACMYDMYVYKLPYIIFPLWSFYRAIQNQKISR